MNRRLFPPINQAKKTGTTVRYTPDDTYHIFDGGGGYTTVQGGQPKIAAEGAAIKAPDGWYTIRSGQWHRIKREDIPAEVRATMLILSLSL